MLLIPDYLQTQMVDHFLFQVTIFTTRCRRHTDAWIAASEVVELARVAEEHGVALIIDEQGSRLLMEVQANMVLDSRFEVVQAPQFPECCPVSPE